MNNIHRDDEIRARAYQLWEEEDRPEGSADRHWFTACESLAAARPIEAPERAGALATPTGRDEPRSPRRTNRRDRQPAR